MTRLPKHVIIVYDNGTVKKFDATDTMVMEKLAEVFTFHDTIERPTPPLNESYKESFYRIVERLGFSRTIKYTDDRARALRARLKAFSLEELLKAAQALRHDDFMSGKNDRGKKYATIDYLLRRDLIVAHWLEQYTSPTAIDLSKVEI